MPTTLITSKDDKGVHATRLFEIAYDQSKLDADGAQRLNEQGGEFQKGIKELIKKLSTPNQFADEETSSSYEYPKEYKGPRAIDDQIKAIAEIFDLDPAKAFQYSKNLPKLPEGAEGWFAVPSPKAIAKQQFPDITDPVEQYCLALQLVLKKLAASREFHNYREGQIDSAHLRMHIRTAQFMQMIAEMQNDSDILIIAAQLGKRHRGRSSRRAREVFVMNEFGLGSVVVGSILLVHPERLVRWEELDIDLPGDEFAPDADGGFSRAPSFGFGDDGAGFGANEVSGVSDCFGSASGFLPQ